MEVLHSVQFMYGLSEEEISLMSSTSILVLSRETIKLSLSLTIREAKICDFETVTTPYIT